MVLAILCKSRRYLPSDTLKLYIILSLTVCQLLQSGVIIRAIACVAGGGVLLFFCGGAREPRKVWEQVKLKFSLAASISPVTIPPATQVIRIITLSPAPHVQILTLSSTSVIFFPFIQSLNCMFPALSNIINSPGVGSEGSEPQSNFLRYVNGRQNPVYMNSKYYINRNKVEQLSTLNTTDESFRDVSFTNRTSHVGFPYQLNKGIRSRD